jgi:putative transcriptional regulator
VRIAVLATDSAMPIKWNLNQLMFDRRIKNADLCELTGLHPNTVSKLKNSHEMPARLDRETLEKLIKALDITDLNLLMEVIPEEQDS